MRVVQCDGKGEHVTQAGEVAAELLFDRQRVGGVGVGERPRLVCAVRRHDVKALDAVGVVGRFGVGVDYVHLNVAQGAVLFQPRDAGGLLLQGKQVIAGGGEIVAVKQQRHAYAVLRAGKGGRRLGIPYLPRRAQHRRISRPAGQRSGHADGKLDLALRHTRAGGGGHCDGFCKRCRVGFGQHAGCGGACQQGRSGQGQGKLAGFCAGKIDGFHSEHLVFQSKIISCYRAL